MRSVPPTWLWLLLTALPCPTAAHDDLDVQIRRLDQAIDASPRMATLFLRRAELHWAHEDAQMALADLRRAERLEPARADLWLLRGRILLESGQAGQALAALEQSLVLQPGEGHALALRARARSLVNDRDGAETDYAAATSVLTRTGPELVLERSLNLQAAGRRDEALKVLDEGIRDLGGAVALWEAALALEVDLGRWSEALARFEAPLKRPGSRAALLARRADILDLAGQAEAAALDRRQALAELDALPASRRNSAANLELRRRLQASRS